MAHGQKPKRITSCPYLTVSERMFYNAGKRHIGGWMHAWAVPKRYPPGTGPSPPAPFAASPKKEGSRFETI